MTQIATTIEQAHRLMVCGVKAETANMYLEKANVPPADYYQHVIAEGINTKSWFSYRGNRDIIPAWSLSRLFDLLPMKLTVGIKVHELRMGYKPYEENFYIRYTNTLTGWDELDSYTDSPSPINACVRMIEWLTKHNYELNTI